MESLESRVRQVLEAQIGNLVVELAVKAAQIDSLTAERDALKAELAKLKEA